MLERRPEPPAQRPSQDHSHWSPLPALPAGPPSVCSDIDFGSRNSFSGRGSEDNYYNGDLFQDLLDDPSLDLIDDHTAHSASYLPITTTQADVIEVEQTAKGTDSGTRHDNPLPPQSTKGSGPIGLEDTLNTPNADKHVPPSPHMPVIDQQISHAPVLREATTFVDTSQLSIPCSQSSARAQNIMACANILSCVEEICDGTHALDEALRINKESMNNISQLLRSSCCRESPGSIVILVQGVRQVVEMLERTCIDVYPGLKGEATRRFSAESLKRPGHFGARSISSGFRAQTLPGIGFGCFNVDPEEQQVIQATLISGQLCRTLDVIRNLSTPLANFVRSGRADMEAMHQVLRDLEQRISHIDVCINCGK